MGFFDAYIKKAVETTIGEMIAEEIAGQGAPKKETAGQTAAGQTPTEQTPAGQTPTEQTPTGQNDTPAGQEPAGQTPTGQTPTGQSDTDYSKIGEMIKKEVGAIASSLKEGAKIPEKLSPEDALASLVGLKVEEEKK